MTIPRELEEAAYIDGASIFQTFLQVVLPLTEGALATLAVITFLATWNDFLWALLVLKDRAVQTLQPGLRTLPGRVYVGVRPDDGRRGRSWRCRCC